MCFYDDDCDWYAEVHTEKFERATVADRCYECGCTIAVGDWCCHINQQQYEQCQICEDGSSDVFVSTDADDYDTAEELADALVELRTHDHDYGETWGETLCRQCLRIRAAIWDLEEKEGCPEHARQPRYGDLDEVLGEDQGRWGDRKYTNHALAMFPELSEHSLLAVVEG